MAIRPGSGDGVFVPTTQVWDVQSIQEVDVNSPDFKELLIRLYQQVGDIANSVNLKDTGYYDTLEFVCGQNYFPNPALNSTTSPFIYPEFRPVFRTVVDFGPLPNAATKSVIHNISCLPGGTTFTRIYATASKITAPLTYIPIPFASPILNENIKITVDNINVNITTAMDYTAYTICYVVLEYLQF